MISSLFNFTETGSDEDFSDESVIERIVGITVTEWKTKSIFWKCFDVVKVCLHSSKHP